MLAAIKNRRSIRRYQQEDVPRKLIEEIIQAGMLAPSSKNRQPWKFIIASDRAKETILLAMKKGLEREKGQPMLPESSQHLKAAEHTLKIMEQAPIVIFVVNPLGTDLYDSLKPEGRVYEICNAQSVGAAIENMALTATELGLGSLWICDTYFAYAELCDCLGADGELAAAVAVGYADEEPAARPRKDWKNVVEWRE